MNPDEGVNTPMEEVGDGGGTTKTQVTLEFRTTTKYWVKSVIDCEETQRVNNDHEIFSQTKRYAKRSNRKCPGHVHVISDLSKTIEFVS